MSTDQNVRRRGLGRLLVQKVEEFALQNGFTKVFLTTLTWMEAACEFYKKNGYVAQEIWPIKEEEFDFDILVQPFMKDLTS